MKIQSMFQKDINRVINGVIKVNDEQSLMQELEEYIITKEQIGRASCRERVCYVV